MGCTKGLRSRCWVRGMFTVSEYVFLADTSDGEFVNRGTGPIRGGMLFAAVPDHLRGEFGPTCVVLEYEGRDDSIFFGELADRVRENIIQAARPQPIELSRAI